ncbi:hypothetical protein BGW42_005587 [Actinomortierella wolfii]|nr:hypothetical protein BGW42_005587 [Actinomortierella wolfii]
MYDPELAFILQAARQLTILEIRGDNFTDDSLQLISTLGPSLKQLTLQTPKLLDNALGEIFNSCRGLKALSLEDCDLLRDEALLALIEAFEQEQTNMSHEESPDNLPQQPTMDRLKVSETHMSTLTPSPSSSRPSSCNSVATVASPTYSTFSSSPPDLTDLSLHHLPSNSKFPTLEWNRRSQLTSLTILRCSHLAPALISQLIGQCPLLESVALGGSAITDDAFKSLIHQPFLHLKRLSLDDCPEVTDDAAMSVFFNCDIITDLTIRESNFTKHTFDAIAACLWPCLERLYLENVRLVLNASVEAILDNCKNLRSLRLWNCRLLTLDLFSDEAASPCPLLEELEFMDKYARPTPTMRIQEQDEFAPGSGDNPQDYTDHAMERYDYDDRRQTESLERFTIIRNPGISVDTIKELARLLPSLVEFGCALNTVAQQNEATFHNMTCRKPRIRTFNSMFETREKFRLYMD